MKMCGIIGFINVKNARKKAECSLKKIAYRGINGKGFYEESNLCFGHCLHSVVSCLKQPLVKDNFVLGANCEIYNWKEIAQQLKLAPRNDVELLFDLLLIALKDKKPSEISQGLVDKTLECLDGPFAFFLYNKKHKYLLIARDIFGERPIWFFKGKNEFIFASEAKAIASKGIEPEELNPRKAILFGIKKRKLNFLDRKFFDIKADENIDPKAVKKQLAELLEISIKRRISDKKTGLLFSAGLDSTILAFLLKKHGVKFTAYMTVEENNKEMIKNAENIARKIGFELKAVKINKKIVFSVLPEAMRLIESSDPVKVEVALTMYLALKEAKKDSVKVIYSGIGADDIFGGYRRMVMDMDLNADSLSFLRKLYERDLYRDDVLAMANNIELRLPYLTKDIVSLLLKIPNRYKMAPFPKPILRDFVRLLGVPEEFTQLKKNAAQYGSGVNKLLSQIVKDHNEKFKGKFLLGLRKNRNIKLGVLYSTGKDSVFAMHIQNRLNYEIACLITIKSMNKDSFMFHTPTVGLARYHAKALGLPLVIKETRGEKEKELGDLKKAMQRAKDKYHIQGIVTGALYSNYQRGRIEKICDELNLKVFSPLWHMDQEAEMRNLIRNGVTFVMTKIAADGLDKGWLGKAITLNDVGRLAKISKVNGLNVAGEGGEFETFVLDSPMFKKRLEIVTSSIIEHSRYCAELAVRKVRLKSKFGKDL